MKYSKIIFFILCVQLLSCNESTSEDTNDITFSVSDFTLTIDENPSINEVLGSMSATTSQGELTFVITHQDPDGFITVHYTSGELTVNDPTLFDFETNPVLNATVEISNGSTVEYADITITLLDIEENGITAFDLEVQLFQIPTLNQNLGTIEAYATEGNLNFSILEQSLPATLEIDHVTGALLITDNLELIVSDIIEATVRVQLENASNVYQDVLVRVYLTYECDIENPTSLLAYYPFDGNALDETSYNNHGFVNAPMLTTDRFSESESAYYFNGIDDVISVPDNEQLYLGNEFTISAWIYPEEIKTQQIIRKGSAVDGSESWPYGLGLSETNDMIFSVTADGTLYQARLSGYTINEWYLITGVLKDQRIYLYINGELVAYESISGNIYDDSLPLLIGTRLSLPSSTFKGKIDDVRIYDTALCEADILSLYTN